ncbi:phosphoribosylaminoimidazolesuccinocarboxamide synthase [Rhodoferax sp. 4810]|uniref:Phosphoribosylaminoimidazole-succinocarboxamide synthase n=1 Tax=Thiospirillum jenense TaxID=1653858 RepID=A0A839HC51_9GAMM|nr:phosphoribosylaminoimidazolesuccinocarboxamide synthase [Thiospirillum jenense]MBB1073220.1 phosphoribosylaminoimidazolesuccinocarboxamide synthase [Rhodoferax jenense]MBB1124619.1 phosphoribosylaminoimidazolesuccinocarboxamide synthase [Thiospirillum jenense]
MNTPLYQSNLKQFPLINRGKVRDLYAVDDEHLLIIASDRLSAFDVVLPQPIPSKGEILTRLSNFWFARTRHLIPNHLSTLNAEEILIDANDRQRLGERATVVRRLQPLPIEAIVRGYLIGSGWNDYRRTGRVCGISLPRGLLQAAQLPEPIYTPSTKAAAGSHDANVAFEYTANLIGNELATQIRDMSLAMYIEAAQYAYERGILIADTKFEFGVDNDGRLHLIDEVLTPDSSRFWPVDHYRPGSSPPSFDKQYVRDYLETLDWNKTAPGPTLPITVIAQTAARYAEAERRLTGRADALYCATNTNNDD